MAECSYSSCIQEKRAIKRELQKWTKDLVYLVGECTQIFLVFFFFFLKISYIFFIYFFGDFLIFGWTLGFGPPVEHFSLFRTLALALV